MPSNDDLLFAEHAVRGGFLTREEVDETLAVQRRMEEMGVRDSLRNVLVNRGVLREGDASIISRQAGLHPGREPIPGYTLESRLGAGAMGTVYKAWQRGMQRHVAVKILRRDLTSDPRQVERLRREAALVGKLDHPNIVRGLDSGEHDGLVWFAMEYVEGETLRDRIRRDGPLPPGEAVAITRQLAEALVHAHAQGVVHRDIKPGNVLVTKEGVPRLSDYGLAKGQTDDALTQLDATLGTPQYVAPEQARNPRDADVRSDVYSLGATLYAMLTGRPPFEGETLTATLTKVLYEKPRPLGDAVPGIDERIVYVVERMMAKDRRHRYSGPAELLDDLLDLERGRLHVPAGFRGDLEGFVESRRHRRLWVLTSAAFAAAVATAGFAWWWDREADLRSHVQEAEQRLTEARNIAGPEPAWDGGTVEAMIRRLEAVRSTFPDTPAGEQAAVDLARWRKQEKALLRAQALARGAAEDDSRWPAAVEAMEAEIRALRADTDTGVARRQVEQQLAGLRDQRERRARRELGTVQEKAAAMEPGAAAAAYAAWADFAQARWWGKEPSPVAEDARAVARRLRLVEERLDHHFDALDAATAGPEYAAIGDFRATQDALDLAVAAAAADRELRDLLAALPAGDSWTRGARVRSDAIAARIVAAAQKSFAELELDVGRRRERGDFEAALQAIRDFEGRSLAEQRVAVGGLRAEVEAQRQREALRQRDAVETAWAEFLDAYARLDVGQAERALAKAPKGAAVPTENGAGADPAAELRRSGARLLDLTERLVWEQFRFRFAAYAAAGNQVTDRRNGIRYGGITDTSVSGWVVQFTYGGSHRWRGTIADLALDDVLRVAAVPRETPEGALVVAALRVTQYVVPEDPRRGEQSLGEIAPLLDTARSADHSALVARLAAVRDARMQETRRRVDDAEEAARKEHLAALDLLEGGRPGEAATRLRSLRDLPRLRVTEYVRTRREEIVQQIERAERAVQTAGYAVRFPGAAWTEFPDGTAELRWDFEDPALVSDEARSVLGVVDGRTRIGSRFLVRADRPAPVAPESGGAAVPLPLEFDHVLEWLAADGRGEPRDAPVRIPCPFQASRRIEVSFRVRAERPLFLGVVVSGVACGVLSAPESPYGGRGITIWNAVEMDRPDRAFDERTRASYLASHPEALRKEGDLRFFHFEPGRVHRVRFVKDERRAQLWVDGRLRADEEVRFKPGPLADRVILVSHGAAEIDDLVVAGTPDPDFARVR